MAKGTAVLERKGKAAVAKAASAFEHLKVIYVMIDEIKPNDYNPNRQTEKDQKLLRLSMESDGFTQPIVVQKGTMTIVDGEHRWRVARELGLLEVPIVLVDMTPEQMRMSTLRHNRARGSEDMDLVGKIMRDLRALGALDWATTNLMMTDEEAQKLIDDVPVAEALASEEFSGAWLPSKNQEGKESQPENHQIVSMTPAAVAAQQTLKERMEKATSTKEQQVIEKETRAAVYRLNIHLTGEDAEVCRGVLEPTPSVKVLEMCRLRAAAAESKL